MIVIQLWNDLPAGLLKLNGVKRSKEKMAIRYLRIPNPLNAQTMVPQTRGPRINPNFPPMLYRP